MRILHCVSSIDPMRGGVSQAVRSLATQLNQLGCENHIVCIDPSGTNHGAQDNFVIHRTGPGRGPWCYSPRLGPWLCMHLPNYQAVIIHGLWQFHGYAVTKAIWKLKKQNANRVPRVFIMPHGMLDPWFQTAPARRIKAWRNWIVWQAIEHRTVSRADGLLFTCQNELELARKPFRPYHPACETSIGFGTEAPPARTGDMDAAFQAACRGLGDRRYMLFLGRIHPKKGADLLLSAYAKVAHDPSNGKPIPALVIAGPLNSAFANEIQHLAGTLNLTAAAGQSLSSMGPAVFFPGMLSGDAKWGAFYNCDAFVLPSHQENFGIAVVEALACSKPVLISNQVNIFSEIESANAGLVAADTFEGTCQLLSNWLEITDERKSNLSHNALTCFRRHFRAESAAKKLLATVSNGLGS